MKTIPYLAYLALMLLLTLAANAANHFSIAKAADACQKSCALDADCGLGGVCRSGFCEHQQSYCLNERWSVNERGETWNCNAYRCNSANGLCFRSATSNDNCTPGYVYDGKSTCVPSITCTVEDPSCQDIYVRWSKARHDYEDSTPKPQPTLFSCVQCSTHDDCGSTQMCWQNRCEKADLSCALAGDGQAVVIDKQGIVSQCQNYACDPIGKACFTQCQASQDCRSGKSCVAGMCM